jgi:hypothetical protein
VLLSIVEDDPLREALGSVAVPLVPEGDAAGAVPAVLPLDVVPVLVPPGGVPRSVLLPVAPEEGMVLVPPPALPGLDTSLGLVPAGD